MWTGRVREQAPHVQARGHIRAWAAGKDEISQCKNSCVLSPLEASDSTPAPRPGLKKEGRDIATILYIGSGASICSLHPGSGAFVPTGR